jgi:hypothetical protein
MGRGTFVFVCMLTFLFGTEFRMRHYVIRKLGCGMTPMYQFTSEEAADINRAIAAALAAANGSPKMPVVAADFVRKFLVREIMRLYREGERDLQTIALDAVGSLRNHLQAQDSAKRLAALP